MLYQAPACCCTCSTCNAQQLFFSSCFSHVCAARSQHAAGTLPSVCHQMGCKVVYCTVCVVCWVLLRTVTDNVSTGWVCCNKLQNFYRWAQPTSMIMLCDTIIDTHMRLCAEHVDWVTAGLDNKQQGN